MSLASTHCYQRLLQIITAVAEPNITLLANFPPTRLCLFFIDKGELMVAVIAPNDKSGYNS